LKAANGLFSSCETERVPWPPLSGSVPLDQGQTKQGPGVPKWQQGPPAPASPDLLVSCVKLVVKQWTLVEMRENRFLLAPPSQETHARHNGDC